MFTTLMTILLALSLVAGGAGATVHAAQDALPNGPLYPVKIVSEDVRLGLTNGDAHLLQLTLAYATRRMDEMAKIGQEGKPVPEEVALRHEEQMKFAFKLAAGMQEPDRSLAMAQIRTQLEKQEQIMEQLRVNFPEGLEPLMAQVQERLQAQNRLCDLEQEDPLKFEAQVREMLQAGKPEGAGNETPGEPNVDPVGPQIGPGPEAGPYPEDKPGPQAKPETEPGMGPGEGQQPDDGKNVHGPGDGQSDSGGNGGGGDSGGDGGGGGGGGGK
jgi:uncharacterized membrane protein YgcG